MSAYVYICLHAHRSTELVLFSNYFVPLVDGRCLSRNLVRLYAALWQTRNDVTRPVAMTHVQTRWPYICQNKINLSQESLSIAAKNRSAYTPKRNGKVLKCEKIQVLEC